MADIDINNFIRDLNTMLRAAAPNGKIPNRVKRAIDYLKSSLKSDTFANNAFGKSTTLSNDILSNTGTRYNIQNSINNWAQAINLAGENSLATVEVEESMIKTITSSLQHALNNYIKTNQSAQAPYDNKNFGSSITGNYRNIINGAIDNFKIKRGDVTLSTDQATGQLVADPVFNPTSLNVNRLRRTRRAGYNKGSYKAALSSVSNAADRQQLRSYGRRYVRDGISLNDTRGQFGTPSWEIAPSGQLTNTLFNSLNRNMSDKKFRETFRYGSMNLNKYDKENSGGLFDRMYVSYLKGRRERVRQRDWNKLGLPDPNQQNTFQEQQRRADEQQGRQSFLRELLGGIRDILGHNPLTDVLRWLFLLLGKSHPILAAIGLTLAPIGMFLPRIVRLLGLGGRLGSSAIGGLAGLFGRQLSGRTGQAIFNNIGRNGIRGAMANNAYWAWERGSNINRGIRGAFGAARNFVTQPNIGGRALQGVAQFTGRHNLGGLARGIAATWSNHPIANGTNPAFVRNIATASGQFFSNLRNTSLIQGVANSGVGKAVGGFMNNGLVRGAGKVLGRIPVLGTALSFAGNMLSGKSLGESATRAGAGTIGATIGGALGTLLGPIGTVIGSVVGGLLGEWVGGKLFGLINRNSNKTEDKLNQIEENTNWLEKIFSFFSKKTKDTDPKNTGGVPLDSYGQGTSVLTPEQAKFNAENAKYLTIYNMRKRGFNDRDIISAGENIKGGVTRADIAAYDQLIRQGKMDYALRTYNSNNAMVQDLKKQGASRDFIISKLTASPEAQAAAQSFLVGRMDQQNGFNLSEALKNHRVTSGFGYRIHPKGTGSSADGKRHFHGGIDIAYGEGEAVRAFTSGKVISVGNANDGYGNVVKIMDDQGRIHQYAHGSKFGNIQVGQRISAGDTIMYAGHTGFATGSHLDYRISKNGKWINPLTGEMSKANAKLSATQKAVATATATQEETATSVATASNGLRQSVFDRVYGKDSSLAKAREIIFTATDVTGSLGVWGITQVNNTGRMRT